MRKMNKPYRFKVGIHKQGKKYGFHVSFGKKKIRYDSHKLKYLNLFTQILHITCVKPYYFKDNKAKSTPTTGIIYKVAKPYTKRLSTKC